MTTAPPSGGQRRILVLKLDHLGDFILGLPALEKLRAEFPHDEITLVCGSWNKVLAEDIGIFDHVVACDFLRRDREAGRGKASGPVAQFKSVLTGFYDIAIDLRPESDTRFLLNHVAARTRMGFGPAVDHPFLDVALPFLPDTGARPIHNRRDYGPERFFSRVPGNDLYLETDFSSTNDIVIFGPYVPLPVGDYVVTFHVSAVGLGLQILRSTIEFDVVQNMVVLARRRLGFWRGRWDLRNGSIAIPFSNRDPDLPFEYRIATSRKPFRGALRFFGVTVEDANLRQAGAPPPGTARLHRGELMSLLVQLVASRSKASALPRSLSHPQNPAIAPFTGKQGSIVIAPMSNGATRDWPLAYYARLVKLILSELDRPIALIGAHTQAGSLEEILRENAYDGRLHNLAGKVQWRELPSLFCAASVVIANHSGVAHFAAASGAPLVVIFSGSHRAEEWGPKGEGTIVMLSMDVPCAPCGLERLEDCTHDHRCMRLISPERVFAEVSRVLAGTRVEAPEQ
ncbi:MAG TPA: glycosyltransferase family 9 protein [Stellaceae bacterium]|nr:glycosyltransferase family 9 protein [Stellaceae bacterium]